MFKLPKIKITLVALIFSFSTSSYAQVPPIQWVKQMQGNYTTYASVMANDPSGNLYTACSFAQKMTIGTQTISGSGYIDICILKTDANGNLLWYKLITAGTGHYVTAMACDAQGNLYVTGFFSGNALFAGTIAYSAGGFDGFLMKLNASGTLQWVDRFGGTGNDGATSLALHPSGNIYSAGFFEGNAGFNPPFQQSAGASDVFVQCNEPVNGTLQWVTQLGGANEEESGPLGCDTAGNIYVAGSFSVATSIGSSNFTSAGGRDVFLTKLEPTMGGVQWTEHIGGPGNDTPHSLVVDHHGDVYTAGNFGGVLSYGNSTLVSVGYSSIFFVKNNGTSGSPAFVQSFGGTSNFNNLKAMSFSGFNKKIYLTGYFDGSFIIGTSTLSSLGDVDIFLSESDTLGTINWADRKGGMGQDIPYALSADAFGNIYTGGFFTETVPYGSSVLSRPGSNGGFMARWGNSSVPTSIIAKDQEKSAVHVFPNPFLKTLTVVVEQQGKYVMELKNILGKTIFQLESDQLEQQLDLFTLDAGVYFLILSSDQGVLSRKLIKE